MGYMEKMWSPAASRSSEPLTRDDDQLSELASSRNGKAASLNTVLNLPETLRQRSSGMVDNLELGTPLGRGSYGKVYKGAHIPFLPVSACPLFVACKRMHCRATGMNKRCDLSRGKKGVAIA